MQYHIAVTDDDDINLKAAELILSFNGYKVSCFKSGEELLQYLASDTPDLILLDLHMTGIDGFETMKRINSMEVGSKVPVIFLTADSDSDNETTALDLGARDFVSKPFVTSVLLLRVRNTIELFHLQNDLKAEVQKKAAEAFKEHERNERLSMQVVKTLAGTIDAKDKYTNGHSSRVAEYAKMIAKRAGYNERALDEIYMMGLLHDVGKIGVPDTIINKPSRLTEEEYETIKTHSMVGYGILKNITEMPKLAIGARSHHERYDGTGYPEGLKGTDIPEEARIIAVADAYDAMSSRRSYHSVFAQEYIKSELKKGRGTQFDPEFADIMLAMVNEDVGYTMREFYDNNPSVDTTQPLSAQRSDEKDEAMFTFLSMLDAGGIETAEGLKYSMNDVSFYTEMLKEFVSGAEDRETAMTNCLAAQDYEKYRVYVHSLKSASKTIGATNLSNLAEKMETAAKNMDIVYIIENNDFLLASLKSTVGGIMMATNLMGDMGDDQ